ncbi:MAG: T9SS type A sorting domain-containing protein [Bacteroidetes bacterium]|nr:T9SS type A sorting domain-containing protein [Bacteroidota bacterium]
MKKKRFQILLFVFIFFSLKYNAATCIALGNGDWATPALWSCGHIPTCGDSVVIPAGKTVTISSQQNNSGCGAPMQITVYGTIKFNSGSKLQMACGSAIYIMSGGSIQPGTGGGNANYIQICGTTYWNAGMGTLSGPQCVPSTLPNCSAALPVELISFTASECYTNKICLTWITATEKNNSYFDIERSSNAIDFETLFYVNSQAINGNSSVKINYEAADEKPVEGLSYYRLKQVDKDQSFIYSSIISVNTVPEKNFRFVIYPNPNSGEFSANISGLENNHEIKIILRDMKGAVLFMSSFYTKEASSTIPIIPQSKLISGTYVCSLYLEEIEYKVKVLVNTRE